jgi:thiol-disulfide isomerase/thioredoxin
MILRLRENMPELNGATMWLNGETTKDRLIGDKPTLIHFWSVSCHICKEAMPTVNEFRDKYKDRLNIVAVHMPRSEQDLDVEKVKEASEKYHITQPIFIDNRHALADAFGNEYVPAYYLFDAEGRLHHYQAGGEGIRLLEKRLLRVISDE